MERYMNYLSDNGMFGYDGLFGYEDKPSDKEKTEE